LENERQRRFQPFDHVWFWLPNPMRRIDRKGQRCRVLVRGSKNIVLVEFEDGFTVVTSRHAVRPVQPDTQPDIVSGYRQRSIFDLV
jgi:hypothetical protein